MDEVVGEEAGASSSSVGADLDDAQPQPAPIPLVESIDEALVPDIIAGAANSSVFQSAWVDLSALYFFSLLLFFCYVHLCYNR